MSRVLIVDDEAGVGEALRLVLEDEGHEVTVLTDPTRTLQALHQAPPDVVLLDVMMAPLNGFEVLARLRVLYPALPVWLMSAHLYGQFDAGVLLGARGFLQKPFVLDDVLAAVAPPPEVPADD